MKIGCNYTRDLRISELGIISDGSNLEMKFDDFAKKIEKNMQNKEGYNIFYNKDKNYFDITFNGNDYQLVLDDKTMNDYLFGKYDNITSRLKQLCDIQLELKKREEAEELRNEIVEKAKKCKNLNDEEKNIYLEYLKEQNNIISVFKNTFKDIKLYNKASIDRNVVALLITLGILLSPIAMSITFIVQFITGFNIWLILKIGLGALLSPLVIAVLPPAAYVILLVGNTIEYFKNKGINRHKIKELTKLLEHTKSNSNSSKMEDKKTNDQLDNSTYDYKNEIYEKMYKLICAAEHVNEYDKNKLVAKIKTIKTEYDEEEKNIEGHPLEYIVDIEELNRDTERKLSLVENELQTIMNKENSHKESLLLEEKFNSIDSDISQVNNGVETNKELIKTKK